MKGGVVLYDENKHKIAHKAFTENQPMVNANAPPPPVRFDSNGNELVAGSKYKLKTSVPSDYYVFLYILTMPNGNLKVKFLEYVATGESTPMDNILDVFYNEDDKPEFMSFGGGGLKSKRRKNKSRRNKSRRKMRKRKPTNSRK